jgi:hypothetical protein
MKLNILIFLIDYNTLFCQLITLEIVERFIEDWIENYWDSKTDLIKSS